MKEVESSDEKRRGPKETLIRAVYAVVAAAGCVILLDALEGLMGLLAPGHDDNKWIIDP